MAVSQPSVVQAIGSITYNPDPAFRINRGFTKVERFTIPPGPGPVGCVLLSLETLTPDECIFSVTALTDILGLGPDVFPQANFHQDVDGNWGILVVTATPLGSADIDFMIVVERINLWLYAVLQAQNVLLEV